MPHPRTQPKPERSLQPRPPIKERGVPGWIWSSAILLVITVLFWGSGGDATTGELDWERIKKEFPAIQLPTTAVLSLRPANGYVIALSEDAWTGVINASAPGTFFRIISENGHQCLFVADSTEVAVPPGGKGGDFWLGVSEKVTRFRLKGRGVAFIRMGWQQITDDRPYYKR